MIMLVFITYNEVLTLVNGILGALVGVTGGCAVFNIYRKCLMTKMWCLYHANVLEPKEGQGKPKGNHLMAPVTVFF